jgi:hypothetical protein
MKSKALSSLIILATLGTAASLTGCGGGGGGGRDAAFHAWYDVFGRYCFTGHPAPGCDFYADGTKIIDIEDPFFASSTLTFGTWDFINVFKVWDTYTGWGWVSPTGILYDDLGIALNTRTGAEEPSRDLLEQAATAEEAKIKEAAAGLEQRYSGLSEASAMHIAETLHELAVLEKSGGRSEADFRAVAKKLTGVDTDTAFAAYKKAAAGDSKALDGLNEQFARNLAVDPETSKEIAKNLLGKTTWGKVIK